MKFPEDNYLFVASNVRLTLDGKILGFVHQFQLNFDLDGDLLIPAKIKRMNIISKDSSEKEITYENLEETARSQGKRIILKNIDVEENKITFNLITIQGE